MQHIAYPITVSLTSPSKEKVLFNFVYLWRALVSLLKSDNLTINSV